MTLLDHHYSPSSTDRGTIRSCVMLPQLWGGGDDANLQSKIYIVDTVTKLMMLSLVFGLSFRSKIPQ